MVSTWKLTVPEIGDIEFKKIYGTLGQKTYSEPESKYEHLYYSPITRGQLLEGRMVGYVEGTNKYYPIKQGGDGLLPGPGEPGGLKVIWGATRGGVAPARGAVDIHAKVEGLFSKTAIPESNIDTEFQYFLVPMPTSRTNYNELAALLAAENLVALTSPILLRADSTEKRVFAIAPDKDKKILVMTKLIESKFIREIPAEAKFKRPLLDEELTNMAVQSKEHLYDRNWRWM